MFNFGLRKNKEKAAPDKKAPVKAPVKPQPAKKAIPAERKEAQGKALNKKRQIKNASGGSSDLQRSIRVISKSEDIPHHHSIISGDGGAIELPKEWQKNFAILLTDREKKEVEIVCSTEAMKGRTNDDFLTIVDQIKTSGYTRRQKWNARPEMIAIIYETMASKKNQEDEDRTATKIQIEFDNLVRDAMAQDSSDIHIEVRRGESRVRLRRNGDLFEYAQWPVSHARTMAGVIYQVIADEKDTTFDEMKPQDAIIDRDLGQEGRIRIRLATIPAYPSGFDMIMRILKMGVSDKRRSLESLGYNQVQLTNVRRAVAKPVGAITMAGTTGSGKSTSLNSMLGEKIEIYKGKIKVITVEDPPEYMLRNATQVPVVRSRSKAQAGGGPVNPFSAVVRAAMRSDPDILMVGEVRDSDSAELLVHAVQSGHQVFTTIHASSAIDIVARMRSNGVPDDVLGAQNFFSALMYQTLLPTICDSCSIGIRDFSKTIENDQDFELLQRIFKYLKPEDANKLRFRHEEGCPKCEKGVIGRSVAAEVILPDPHMLQCFRERRDSDALLHYRHKGGKISLEHGLLKSLQGKSDIRDVEHKLDQMTLLDELNYAVQVYVDPSSATERVDYSICISALGDDSIDEAINSRDKEKKSDFMLEFSEFIERGSSESAEVIKGKKEEPADDEAKLKEVTTEKKEVKNLAELADLVNPSLDKKSNLDKTGGSERVRNKEAIDNGHLASPELISMDSEKKTGEQNAAHSLDVASRVDPSEVSESSGDAIDTVTKGESNLIENSLEKHPDNNIGNNESLSTDKVDEDNLSAGKTAQKHYSLEETIDEEVVAIGTDESSSDSGEISSATLSGQDENLSEETVSDKSDAKDPVKLGENESSEGRSDTVYPSISEDAAIAEHCGDSDKRQDDPIKRFGNIVSEFIRDELDRNGIKLSPRFLHSRSSEASVKSMIANESLDKAMRDELQEIYSDSGIGLLVSSMNPDELFEAVFGEKDKGGEKPDIKDSNSSQAEENLLEDSSKTEGHKFKSRLLGQKEKEAEGKSAIIKDIGAARKRIGKKPIKTEE